MNLKKIIAVFTSTCFLTSFVFYQPIDAAMEMHHDVQEFKQILGDFMLPATVGRITQGKYYGSSKVVINIQDLHCHPEVQRNISRAVGLLIDKYKIGNIYVEGAAGNVNTGWLADVKEKQLRKDIVETLLDQGKLTGVEYYSITENRPDLIKGIEDEKPYEQNIVRLGRMLERKGYYDKKTAGLNKDLGMMQKRYFNGKNLRLNEIIASYRKGNLTTEKFYRILDKYVEKINRHPDDYGNIFTINRDKYRNVWGYLELVDSGRELNYRRIAQQIQMFMGVLKQKLPYSAYNLLLEKTDNFSRLDELYVYLSRICKEYKLDITGTYPDLAKFFRYIDKGQTVNPILLTKEERKLIEEIRLGLSQDSTELEISFLVDFFTYFEDYLYNRLTAEDYVYFMQQFDRFQSLWEKYAFQNHIDDMKPDFAMLNEYYKVNDARNNSFMGHLLGDFTNTAAVEPEGSLDRNIARVVDSLGRSDEIIVVVAGGFHTEGLEELLNGRKISYVEITPNVTQDTKKSSEVYVQMAKIQAKILSSSLALKLLSTLDPQHRDWAKVSALVAARLTGKGVDIKDPVAQRKLLDLLNSSGLDLNVKELKIEGDMLKVVRQEQDRTATMTVNLKGDLVESIARKLDTDTATRNEFYAAAIKQTAAILSRTTAPADIETPYKFLRALGLSEPVIDMFERSGMATGLIYDIYQLTKQHPDLTVDRAGIEKLYHVLPSLQEMMLVHEKKDAAVKEKLPPSFYAVDLFRDLVIALEPLPAGQRVTLAPGTENTVAAGQPKTLMLEKSREWLEAHRVIHIGQRLITVPEIILYWGVGFLEIFDKFMPGFLGRHLYPEGRPPLIKDARAYGLGLIYLVTFGVFAITLAGLGIDLGSFAAILHTVLNLVGAGAAGLVGGALFHGTWDFAFSSRPDFQLLLSKFIKKIIPKAQKEEINFTGEMWVSAGAYAYKIWSNGREMQFQRYDSSKRTALGGVRTFAFGQEYSVGRANGDYTLAGDQSLSGRHFSIMVRPGATSGVYTASIQDGTQDRGSTNGTAVEYFPAPETRPAGKHSMRDVYALWDRLYGYKFEDLKGIYFYIKALQEDEGEYNVHYQALSRAIHNEGYSYGGILRALGYFTQFQEGVITEDNLDELFKAARELLDTAVYQVSVRGTGMEYQNLRDLLRPIVLAYEKGGLRPLLLDRVRSENVPVKLLPRVEELLLYKGDDEPFDLFKKPPAEQQPVTETEMLTPGIEVTVRTRSLLMQKKAALVNRIRDLRLMAFPTLREMNQYRTVAAEEERLMAELFNALLQDPDSVAERNLRDSLVKTEVFENKSSSFIDNLILILRQGKLDTLGLVPEDRKAIYDVIYNKARIWKLPSGEYTTFKDFLNKSGIIRNYFGDNIRADMNRISITFVADGEEFLEKYEALTGRRPNDSLRKGILAGSTGGLTTMKGDTSLIFVNLGVDGFGKILSSNLHEITHAISFQYYTAYRGGEVDKFLFEGLAEHFSVHALQRMQDIISSSAFATLAERRQTRIIAQKEGLDAYQFGYIFFLSAAERLGMGSKFHAVIDKVFDVLNSRSSMAELSRTVDRAESGKEPLMEGNWWGRQDKKNIEQDRRTLIGMPENKTVSNVALSEKRTIENVLTDTERSLLEIGARIMRIALAPTRAVLQMYRGNATKESSVVVDWLFVNASDLAGAAERYGAVEIAEPGETHRYFMALTGTPKESLHWENTGLSVDGKPVWVSRTGKKGNVIVFYSEDASSKDVQKALQQALADKDALVASARMKGVMTNIDKDLERKIDFGIIIDETAKDQKKIQDDDDGNTIVPVTLLQDVLKGAHDMARWLGGMRAMRKAEKEARVGETIVHLDTAKKIEQLGESLKAFNRVGNKQLLIDANLVAALSLEKAQALTKSARNNGHGVRILVNVNPEDIATAARKEETEKFYRERGFSGYAVMARGSDRRATITDFALTEVVQAQLITGYTTLAGLKEGIDRAEETTTIVRESELVQVARGEKEERDFIDRVAVFDLLKDDIVSVFKARKPTAAYVADVAFNWTRSDVPSLPALSNDDMQKLLNEFDRLSVDQIRVLMGVKEGFSSVSAYIDNRLAAKIENGEERELLERAFLKAMLAKMLAKAKMDEWGMDANGFASSQYERLLGETLVQMNLRTIPSSSESAQNDRAQKERIRKILNKVKNDLSADVSPAILYSDIDVSIAEIVGMQRSRQLGPDAVKDAVSGIIELLQIAERKVPAKISDKSKEQINVEAVTAILRAA